MLRFLEPGLLLHERTGAASERGKDRKRVLFPSTCLHSDAAFPLGSTGSQQHDPILSRVRFPPTIRIILYSKRVVPYLSYYWTWIDIQLRPYLSEIGQRR